MKLTQNAKQNNYNDSISEDLRKYLKKIDSLEISVCQP
uniref:Uncharacterized protein n=1 Tax=Tetranychus urticae TaxID=32264 RepID=T1K4W9_TETUR